MSSRCGAPWNGRRPMSKVSLTVNGGALALRSSRARISPTCCARRTTLPALISAASTASAAPAHCLSTARRYALASPSPSLAKTPMSPPSKGSTRTKSRASCRAAFTAHHALQCGYCTPGMIVSARDIVLRLERADEHDIRVAMSGNLCRCTGYVGIVRAIQSVIADRRSRGVAAVPEAVASVWGRPVQGAPVKRMRTPAVVASAAPRAVSRAAARDGLSREVEPDWKPQVEFRQSFVIAHPVEEVWAFFGRVDDVAACLPGASLDGGERDGRVDGKIRVKAGPISAEFTGIAQITRDEDDASRRDRRFGPRRAQQFRDARHRSLTPSSWMGAAAAPASMLMSATR